MIPNAPHEYNVTIKFRLDNPTYDPATCEPNNGLFNMAVVKDGAAGSGFQDDDCMPPPNPPTSSFEIEKGPRPTADHQGAVKIGPNGTAELVYTVTVKNASGTEGATPVIEDRFWIPEHVTPSGEARISVNVAEADSAALGT